MRNVGNKIYTSVKIVVVDDYEYKSMDMEGTFFSRVVKFTLPAVV